MSFKQPAFNETTGVGTTEGFQRMPPPPAVREAATVIDSLPASFFVAIFVASISFGYAYNSTMNVKSPFYAWLMSLLQKNRSPEELRDAVISAANRQILPLDLDKDERAMPRPFLHMRVANPTGFGPIDVNGEGVVPLMKIGAALVEVGPVTLNPSGAFATGAPAEGTIVPRASRLVWGEKSSPDSGAAQGTVIEEFTSPLPYSSAGSQTVVRNLRKAVIQQAEDSIARHSRIGVICAPESIANWGQSLVDCAKAVALFADYLILEIPASVDRSESTVTAVLQQIQQHVCGLMRDEDAHRPPVFIRLPADADQAFVDLVIKAISTPADVPAGSEPPHNFGTGPSNRPISQAAAPPAPPSQRMLIQGIQVTQERDRALKNALAAAQAAQGAALPLGVMSTSSFIGKTGKKDIASMVNKVWTQMPEYAKQSVIVSGAGVTSGAEGMELIGEGAAFVMADIASLGYGGLKVLRTVKDGLSTQMIVGAYNSSMHAVGHLHAIRKEKAKEEKKIKSGKLAKPKFGEDKEKYAILKAEEKN